MAGLRQLVCDVWLLAKGYWESEERWSARLLLAAVVGLNLGLVGVNILQNQANGRLYTALQQQDKFAGISIDYYKNELAWRHPCAPKAEMLSRPAN
jgi:ABC-type uncharacterized transport system fused permease/ATPase subunit